MKKRRDKWGRGSPSERREDFETALHIVQELWIAYGQTDVLSVADKENMMDLLGKPYIREIMKGTRYYTTDVQATKDALAVLKSYPKERQRMMKSS